MKHQKILIVFFIFISLFIASINLAQADFVPTAWKFKAKINTESITSDSIVILDILPEFFGNLRTDMNDLRIVDQDGEVPYALLIDQSSHTISKTPTNIIDQKSLPGESTTVIVDIGQENLTHNSLTLETLSKNFRRIVEVQGSSDKTYWKSLNPRGQIFDYTVEDINPISVQDTTITYPATNLRYLSIKISDQGKEEYTSSLRPLQPLRIDGVYIIKQTTEVAKELIYEPQIETVQKSKERVSEIIIDLGANGIPHKKGSFTTEDKNFSRLVVLSASEDKTNWQFLGNGYIFSINTPQFTGDNLNFQYPESNRRYLRATIINKDDKPLNIKTATLSGTIRKILFNVSPNKTYYAYLGNPTARRAEYKDIEKVLQYTNIASLSHVSAIYPLENNANYTAPVQKQVPLLERSPYILPMILTLVIVILAFLLLRVTIKK